MIEYKRVVRRFAGPDGEEVTAVAGVELVVEAGETLCLVGTSGCGKTTLLKLTNRLLEPSDGAVEVGGEDTRDLDPVRLRRRMGYVVQAGALFPHRTVADNVGLLPELEGWDPARRRDRVRELLALVNLDPEVFADRYPRELSGGQRQRVGVARALALDPPYLLMDEPFGALDPITRVGLHAEFVELQKAVAKTVVLVTHDLAEAFALGDRVALMDGGKVVQVGGLAEFRDAPATPFVAEFFRDHMGGAAAGGGAA